MTGIAFVEQATPLPLLLALLAASGIFRSIGFTAYNSAAFADVEPERMTGANTLMSTLQELGAGLGVAVGALLVRVGEPLSGSLGLGSGPAEPFRVAFVMLAVILVGPAIEALRLPRSAGNEVEQTVMAGCSHLPMWEQPDAYNALVADWLGRRD